MWPVVPTANTDINVYCGTNRMELHILLCPVYFGGYNETLMSLNAQYFKGECRGTPDWTVDPPILKYNFSITEEAVSACNNKIKVILVCLSSYISMVSH